MRQPVGWTLSVFVYLSFMMPALAEDQPVTPLVLYDNYAFFVFQTPLELQFQRGLPAELQMVPGARYPVRLMAAPATLAESMVGISGDPASPRYQQLNQL